MVLVKVHHLRQLGHCMSGSRDWFKRYGLDWNRFLDEGLPVEEFEKTGDHLGIEVALAARAEADNGQPGGQ